MNVKKCLSFVFVFCVCLSIICSVPYSVYAENEKTFEDGAFRYYIYHDNAYITGYTGNSTDVSFPSYIAGYTVVGLGKPTSLDPYGYESRLAGLDNVSTVYINGNIKHVYTSAFSNYSNLKRVTMSEGIQTIGWGAFSNCVSLDTIIFPESIVRIGANALNNTGWYNNQKDGVIYAGKFAYGYKGMMPKKYTLSLKSDTLGIASQAFLQQENLFSVSVPDSLFCVGTNALRGTAWYDNQNYGVVYLGNVVYSYKGMILPNSKIELKKGTIGIADGAFFDDAGSYMYSDSSVNLNTINIPDTVKYIGDSAFLNCDNLYNLYLPKGILYIGDFSYGYHNNGKANPTFSGRGKYLHSSYNTTIEDYAIYNRLGYNESAPKETINSLQKYGDFYYLPLEDGSAEILGYTGQSADVFIPDSINTRKVTKIGNGAFQGENSIKSITIPDSVIFIGSNAFIFCYNLENVQLGNSIRRIEDSAFRYCYSLKKLTIPDSVLSLGEWCFSNCTALTDVSLGKNLKRLNRNAFSFCSSLKYVDLGDGVIDIGWQAFEECNKLNSIYIPDSVLYIGEQAFVNCTALQSVYLRDNLEIIDDRAFGYYTPNYDSFYEKLSNFTIYCFSETVAENYAKNAGIKYSKMSPVLFSVPHLNCRANESLTAELNILYKNYSAGDVVFESSNSNIAYVVESDGDYNPYCKYSKVNIKCVSVGVANITAKLPDGNSAIITINVIEGLNGISVYSNYQDLSVRNGSLIKIGAGILINGYRTDDISKLTYTIYDNSILEVKEISVHDNCRFIVAKAISPGTTYVSFSDSKTGYVTRVPVTVYEGNSMSYTVEGVPQQKIDKYVSNFYNINGIFVDNYSYIKNTNGSCTVSFDVYNSKYIYGAVEIYDENGKIKDAVIIDKKTNNVGSIKDSVWDNSCNIISDIWNGNINSYRQESGFSKKTQIKITIPENGYINITNDTENSSIVSLVNAFDCCLQGVGLYKDIKGLDISDAYLPAQELTKEMLKNAVSLQCFNDQPKFTKKLLKNAFKKTFLGNESVGTFGQSVTNNIQSLNLEKICTSALLSCGVSVGESIFENMSGVFGLALKGMFTFGDAANLYIEIDHISNSQNSGYITIQNQSGNARNCLNVQVKSDTNFNSDTALKVFRLYADDDLVKKIKEVHPDVYDLITNESNSAYDISMIKDGKEIQLDKKVEVSIPISDKLNFLASKGLIKVCRVEEDGTTTDMKATYKDGRLIFTTNHFSVYIVTVSNHDLFGDVNGDGNIDITDATYIQMYIANLIDLSDEAKLLADTNGDGNIDIADATYIQMYLANLIDKLG